MDDFITVVSGLPRSGTSLLMQMLAAGGVEPLTDGERAADEDNPRGYLELESVKKLAAGATPDWVAAARGRAVKVISHLTPHLPGGESYRIVFVERDLDEVLASQAKMIARLGRPAPPLDAVRRAFESHLAAFDRSVAGRPGVRVLRVAYSAILADPPAEAERIAEFVGEGRDEPLDVAAMAAAVDPALYRNRRDA